MERPVQAQDRLPHYRASAETQTMGAGPMQRPADGPLAISDMIETLGSHLVRIAHQVDGLNDWIAGPTPAADYGNQEQPAGLIGHLTMLQMVAANIEKALEQALRTLERWTHGESVQQPSPPSIAGDDVDDLEGDQEWRRTVTP